MSEIAVHQVRKSSIVKPARNTGWILQRTCACGSHSGSGECESCQHKREDTNGILQRSTSNTSGKAGRSEAAFRSEGEVPPIVHEVLRSPGQPLDPATRAYMEPRFGHDFSRVRVHDDTRAAESAQSVNALAYTVGRDVVFGAGQYSPGSPHGQRLLAHELTHVVQQGSSSTSGYLQQKLSINQPGDRYEREADRNASNILANRDAYPLLYTPSGADMHLQRSCADGKCDECLGGNRDFWVTVYFRRRATRQTMTNLRAQINEAKRILANCCLNLKFDFNWTLLRGPSVFPAPTARPAGDPLGPLDYPADTETLGEGTTFSDARGVPMLVVDDVPGSGGGVTMLPGLDAEYTGRNYFAIAVNQPAPNPNCNHIAHELWHMTGAARHDPAEGEITACTSNRVSETYCRALRMMVAPVGDFPTPTPSTRPGATRMA